MSMRVGVWHRVIVQSSSRCESHIDPPVAHYVRASGASPRGRPLRGARPFRAFVARQLASHPPVSLKRLEYREDSRVLYRGNYLPSLGRDHQLCSGVEFLALLIPHIALRYECRIQSFGALATTIRRELGWIRNSADEQAPPDVLEVQEDESEFVRLRRANWARLIARTWFEDPSLCGCCGQPMKVISAISSPEQDDVIEKILRARGEWDPPMETRAKGSRSPAAAGDVQHGDRRGLLAARAGVRGGVQPGSPRRSRAAVRGVSLNISPGPGAFRHRVIRSRSALNTAGAG